MAFTLYTDVYGVMNMTGHLFKVASFYVLLVGVLVKSLKDPLYTVYLPILQAQEIFLRGLTGPSFVLDADGLLVISNRGLPSGSPLETILPEETAGQVNEWIQTAKTTGQPVRKELYAGGKHLSVSVQALHDSEGAFAGTAFISLDRTEERRKQIEIRRLSSIVENSLNEIYLFHPETFQVEFANRGALRALGRNAEEIPSLTPMDIAPRISREWLAKRTALLLSNQQEMTEFTTVHRRRDGTEYPVWIRLQAVGEGTSRRIAAIGLDMTERNRTLYALRGKTAELGQLFQNAPLGLFLCDLEGRVRRVNERALRIFGFRRAEMIGKTIEELLVPEEDLEISRGHWKILYEEKRGFSLEARRLRKDKSPVWVHLMGFPLLQMGAVGGAYLIYQDITQQKEAKTAIETLNRQLENRLSDLNEAWKQTVLVLTRASEARDPYTAGHQRRVAHLARAIAEEMGMEPQACSQVEMAALVHDIGKIEVPSEILVKPGTLSRIEFQLIQTHPEAGWKILKEIVLPWPLAEIVYQHHERLDGSGYPRGLKGREILAESRIIAVADTVEAMASHRPYRPALGIDRALKEIERNRGTGFEPLAVDACLRLFREKGYQLREE